MSQTQLIEEILRLSVAKKWSDARREWTLIEVYEAETPETCLCGQFPIIELCILENLRNGAQATVGNVCVKRFIGLPSDKIFDAVKKIRNDRVKSLNPDAIKHAYDRNWINKWERDFYLDIWRKRNLTEKQETKKIQINERVLQNMKRR